MMRQSREKPSPSAFINAFDILINTILLSGLPPAIGLLGTGGNGN
jgi:hypothetical protein